MRKLIAAAVLGLACLPVAVSQAAPTLVNGDFELPLQPPDGTSDRSVDNWTYAGGPQIGYDYGVQRSADGTLQYAYMYNATNGAQLYQQLSESLVAGTKYTLIGSIRDGSFDPGAPTNISKASMAFTLFDAGAPAGVLATTGTIALNPDFTEYQFAYTAVAADAGKSFGVVLTKLSAPGNEPDFDNVSVTAVAVPEPASLGLLLSAGLLMTRRSRKG